MKQTILLDPTAETEPATRPRQPRPASLDGQTIALLDIGKPRGDVFLDTLAPLLEQRGATVKRFRKPTFTRVAPIDLKQEIAEACTLVIEALAD